MARIGVVNVPFFSHVGAATRLMRVLCRQGHEVTAWGPEPDRAKIEASGAGFELHQPAMPSADGFEAFVAELAASVEQHSEQLIEQLFAADIDLVIHDSQVPWARIAADYLGIPRIVSHPMFPIVSPQQIADDPDAPVPKSDPDADRERFRAGWLAVARRWGVELGDWHEVIHSVADHTFTYTTQEILGDFELRPGWQCVGPLMDPIERRPAPGDRPLVFVCFGTSFNRRMHQFESVIEGLAREPVDVLISTGKSHITAADLQPLPPNVVVRDFVASREVLASASVHVTHCGCNSMHESLVAGVPMVCIPQAFDQFPLAGTVAKLGAGRHVAEDAGAIRDAVRWLLLDELPRQRTADLREHLMHYDGERRVAEVIDAVLAESVPLSA